MFFFCLHIMKLVPSRSYNVPLIMLVLLFCGEELLSILFVIAALFGCGKQLFMVNFVVWIKPKEISICCQIFY